MKVSKTLTNEELSERVLTELEDVVISVCNDVAEGIDIQLRKSHHFLDRKQKEELVNHLREKVNLKLTINVGIQTNDLAIIEIYPIDMLTRGLDSFVTDEEKIKENTLSIQVNDGEPVTITQKQFEDFPEHIENNLDNILEEDETILMLPSESLAEYNDRKQRIQDEVYRAERKRRAEAQA
jgi:hypothetical protein